MSDGLIEPHRRNWIPPLMVVVADQLVEDYRTADDENTGAVDAMGTIESWKATAREHGDEWQDDDWFALVIELACRAAGFGDIVNMNH